MWRRPLEWNLNGTTDPRDGSVDHLSLNSLKDRHGPIRAPKSVGVVARQVPQPLAQPPRLIRFALLPEGDPPHDLPHRQNGVIAESSQNPTLSGIEERRARIAE